MRKGMRRAAKTALLVLLSLVLMLSQLTVATATDGEPDYVFDKASDPEHYSSFMLDQSTLFDGYLWTNKDVSATNMSYLLPDGDTYNTLAAPANQLIACLSTMGQTYPVIQGETETKEANIVMVLDLSSSMDSTVSANESRKRIDLMKDVAQEFVDSLYSVVRDKGNPINIAVVTYAGYGYTDVGWTAINETTAASIKTTISRFSKGSRGNNTNCQAGLYLAKLLYSEGHAPANVNNENCNNFVLFMSDGAPNRSYGVEDIPTGQITSGSDARLKTFESGSITRAIVDTDYKELAAYRTLKEINDIAQVPGRNMTVFSLGLGAWFETDADNSIFPTAPHLLQLCAAVGNKQITLEEAETYLGGDIADGLMPGNNPGYPNFVSNNFKNGSVYRLRGNQIGYLSFSTWELTLNAIETDSRWNKSTAADRLEDGIFYLPPTLVARVRNYYAGNTAAKFEQSFSDITNAILVSFDNYITEVIVDPEIDGCVTFVDKIGEYMEVKDFKGLCFNGRLYNTSLYARVLSAAAGNVYNIINSYQYFTVDAFDNFLRSMSYHMGYTFTKQSISVLVESCIAGGCVCLSSKNVSKRAPKMLAPFST